MMTEQLVFKIGEVSARLGLVDKNSNTLRAWSEEFGEFLSGLANPAPGQPRRFTGRDLHILTAVRDYRANHLSYDEIRERLRAGEHDVTSSADRALGSNEHVGAADDAASRARDAQSLMPMVQLDRLLAPLTASADEWRRLAEEYRGRLEIREARIEALEHRIDDLYARLEGRDDAAHPAVPSTAAGAAEAPTTQTFGHDVPGPNGAGARNGTDTASSVSSDANHGQAKTIEDSQSIFPLPVRAPNPPDGASEDPAASGTVPRRHWWQLWR